MKVIIEESLPDVSRNPICTTAAGGTRDLKTPCPPGAKFDKIQTRLALPRLNDGEVVTFIPRVRFQGNVLKENESYNNLPVNVGYLRGLLS